SKCQHGLDKLTQENAAGAEELAGTSVELTNQATQLSSSVSALHALVGGRAQATAGSSPQDDFQEAASDEGVWEEAAPRPHLWH
ncbi:MAG: hypothetical protein KDD69_14245, partial [Bdellovibrionales bacterium]|nr:hypothetical protein [Bdellovibrionales bacterium]